MIRVLILRNAEGESVGLETRGHAEYEDAGKDIVCAAVSVLELNLANSVSTLTEARFKSRVDEKTGTFSFRLLSEENSDAKLLLRSCILGMRGIEEEYGKKFLEINNQEV